MRQRYPLPLISLKNHSAVCLRPFVSDTWASHPSCFFVFEVSEKLRLTSPNRGKVWLISILLKIQTLQDRNQFFTKLTDSSLSAGSNLEGFPTDFFRSRCEIDRSNQVININKISGLFAITIYFQGLPSYCILDKFGYNTIFISRTWAVDIPEPKSNCLDTKSTIIS